MFVARPLRQFAAMDQPNPDLFQHSFTNDMKFVDKFEKIKCFRVMDEEGNIVTPGYDTTLSDDEMLKMHDAMVTMNECD